MKVSNVVQMIQNIILYDINPIKSNPHPPNNPNQGFKNAQAKMMLEQAGDVDIIITTALIPGRKAPILVTEDMLAAMKTGSVIVDLAAANGGNVEASKPDEIVVTDNGVTIVGFTDLPSRLPATSSTLFSNNVKNFLLSIGPHTTKTKGYFHIDTEDEAVDNMMIIRDGVIRWGTDAITPYSPPPPKQVEAPKSDEEIRQEKVRNGRRSESGKHTNFFTCKGT